MTLKSRIKALTFYGCGDECYELFQKMCSLCYQLYGLGLEDRAEIVCRWCEEDAAISKSDSEEHGFEDHQQGYWGQL